jgi:hypothetical protein
MVVTGSFIKSVPFNREVDGKRRDRRVFQVEPTLPAKIACRLSHLVSSVCCFSLAHQEGGSGHLVDEKASSVS